MTKIKFGSISSVIALTSILIIFGAFLLSFSKSSNSTYADITPDIRVQKVVLPDVYDKASYKSNEHILANATDITNGDFVMLNTEAQTYLNDTGSDVTAREAIFVYFGGSNEISIRNVNIRLNGRQILSERFSSNEDEPSFSQYLHGLTPEEVRGNSPTPLYSGDGEIFSDLESGVSYLTKYTTGSTTEVAAPEGRYEIVIQYTDITATPSTKEWSFTFYLTTQKTYNSVFEKPTLNDTEKFELSNQDSSMLHYFNYNNYYTTIYDETGAITSSLNDKLYYPQLYYNPEKYEITYTRTWYNYIENVSLSFREIYTNASQYGELVVSTTTNTGISTIRTYNIAKGENGYTIRLQFDEVGEYIINKKARLRIEDSGNSAQYIEPTGDVITANAELFKTEKLVINGYVAKYAKTRTSTAVLYDDTYAYNAMTNPITTQSVIYAHDFTTSTINPIAIATVDPTSPDEIYTADFTFLNTNNASLGNASVYDTSGLTTDSVNVSGIKENIFKDRSNGGLFNLNATNIISASTNLAPVMFDFYGKLQANASSWYAYQDTLGNITINTYSRNYQFQEAGTYLVYLSYENLIAESGQPEAGNGKKNQYCHQIFLFEITNTQTKVEIYSKATDTTPGILDDTATILNSGDYTNQYVYASWEAPGPFDAQVMAKYFVYDWNDGTVLREGTLNALVYQKNTVVSTETPTLLHGTNVGTGGLDGNYQIQVFRVDALQGGNDPEAFVNHTFAIDTAPISGISAVSVNGSMLADSEGNIDIFSSLTDRAADFTLATNKNFAWTWSDKASHANIYAKYIYSNMQNIADYNLTLDYINTMNEMAANKQAVLMPTNMQFSTFAPAIDYFKVDLNSPYAILSSSQIISTSQLAILLLYDDAGNTAIFATVLDKSGTKILQNPLPNSYSNIITDTAELYWGTHKSISILTTNDESGQIKDILDYIANGENGFEWALAGRTYFTNDIIKEAFNEVISNSKLNLPIRKVTISTSDEELRDADITPYQDTDGTPHNWYASLTVTEPVDTTVSNEYTTQILPDGLLSANHPLHTLVDGEFYYSVSAIDSIGNSNDSFNIWVNLDRSRGSMQSYKTFDSSDGNSLGSERGLNSSGIDKTTNRQTVANKYSTNRRFVTFSWTQPDATYSISSIVLKYYPFAYNSQISSYPYSGGDGAYDDDNATTVVLYDKSNPESAYEYYTFSYLGREYYQTRALMLIDYDNGYQSSPGKYVIIRTYDNFDESINNGDVGEKTYTYYVDRNPIIPADTTNYGSDIKLQFGYNLGDYNGYPNYGDVYFNSFSRTTNNETFADTINFTNLTPKTPEKIAIESNILPGGIALSTWTGSNGNSTYDKYFPANETIDAETANEYLNGIFEKYKNSSRIQIAVQYFKYISGTSYSFVNQKFYSSVVGNDTSDPYNCYPLDDLDKAFKNIGRYRVVIFDMANMTGVLRGNALSDYRKLTYNTELDLAPNYTIFNFELTGVAPEFNFQSGENTFTNIDVAFNDVTNASKIRVTWADPSDSYTAQIAFNNIDITKTYYTKKNPKIDANGNEGSGITSFYSFANPVTLTINEDEYNELINSGETAIYKPTMAEIEALLAQEMTSSSLSESSFYRVKINGVYNYYIMMPKVDLEDTVQDNTQALNGNKLADVEYTATVHYIVKDENNNEYITESNSTYYQTTKSVYVDNTAPYQNLVKLIKDDVYLNSLNTYGENFTQAIIDNIDNPSFSFLKSYAFAVPRGFALDYINKYETGLNYYYYKRSNYTGAANQQTVTNTQSGSQGSVVFSPARTDLFIPSYYKQSNSSTYTVFDEVGYYDIIEQDRAGNLRIYTIFVTDFSNEMHATINDDNIDITTTIQTGTTVNYNNAPLYTSDDEIVFNSSAFNISSITNPDKWLIFRIENTLGNEAETLYYAPENTLSNLAFWDSSKTIISSLDGDNGIIARLNAFIEETALAHQNDRGGCQIKLTIFNRLQAADNIEIFVNTEGVPLITNQQEFLNLITVNNDGTFTIKMPQMTKSNYLTSLRVYMNSIQQSSDSLLQKLPTSASDFNNTVMLQGFTFRLSTNTTYRFEFIDNFGNTMRYSYPNDDTLVKSLRFTGNTAQSTFDNKTYTYTSSETRFVYQSSSLRLKLTITDATTGNVLYTNILADGSVEVLKLDTGYFDVVVNDLNTNITTLIFHAPINIHYIFDMSVDNYTDTPENFDFAIYTYFPIVSLTDTAGSPLINQVTSKAVQIRYTENGTLFNPYVTVVYPSGNEVVVSNGLVVEEEGTYEVRLYNALGLYAGTGGTTKFTIRLYDVAIYGVYQINSAGVATQLTARDELYSYMLSNGISAPRLVNIPHYVYLSSNRDWNNNIQIVTNQDKGLICELFDEYRYGNTRIYHVYGRTTHYIDTYFAVTCILSNTNNISLETGFTINGETPTVNQRTLYTKETDTEKAKAILSWNTSYIVNSTDGTADTKYDNEYENFYTLELWYNGVKVGNFISGNMTLTQSGVYTIRLHDAVSRNQYFGANFIEFTLTILNDVVYYVNDLAPIQYATYSSDVDIFIPSTFSGDLRQYDSLEVSIIRNNQPYTLRANNGHYLFTEAGVYVVSMTGSIKSTVGTSSAPLYATYQFTILSPYEALSSYEFTAITGYEVISVISSSDGDITDEIRGENAKIHSFYIDAENFGIGRYTVTVLYAGDGYNPSQEYSFEFWINNEEPVINCSRDWGSSSTAGFSITINAQSIYERVGDCVLLVNGEVAFTINQETAANLDPQTFDFSNSGTYIIQLQSASGNILSSHRVTINVPLNTAAIILIVVACVVVIGLIITFILMRTRMKVR